MAWPGGTRTTAASSGACRPISTSARSTGASAPSARESTVAPTLAPQPPQRMAIAEMACAASSSSSLTALAGACALVADIGAKSLNLAMKSRSMRSFQRHSQLLSRPVPEPKPQPPREATAKRSPVLIRANQLRCGRYARSAASFMDSRKFLSSGWPWRTANTPAFSSGLSTMLAISPAAKTRASLMLCKCALT